MMTQCKISFKIIGVSVELNLIQRFLQALQPLMLRLSCWGGCVQAKSL